MKKQLSGCLAGGLRFTALIGATLPMYLIAVVSFGKAFLATSSGDEAGWMFFLFPLLAIPPFVPWLAIAVPIALALSFRHIAVRTIGIFLAALAANWAATNLFASSPDYDSRVTSRLGDIGSVTFVVGIWILAGFAWLATKAIWKDRNNVQYV